VSTAPAAANPHGAPVRIYLNQKVTPHLLEGVKQLAVHEPEKPLKWLAEFLAKKSEEIEGS
jgi:COMPASS component SDC1